VAHLVECRMSGVIGRWRWSDVGECRSEVRVWGSEVRVVGEGEVSATLGLAPSIANAPTIGGDVRCSFLGISSPCHVTQLGALTRRSLCQLSRDSRQGKTCFRHVC
jgi:hypothetical protein